MRCFNPALRASVGLSLLAGMILCSAEKVFFHDYHSKYIELLTKYYPKRKCTVHVYYNKMYMLNKFIVM